LLVEIGICTPEAVMEVGGVEDDSQFRGAGCEGAGEGDRVGSAGEADGEAKAGFEQG
jgi:hypothetical protein